MAWKRLWIFPWGEAWERYLESSWQRAYLRFALTAYPLCLLAAAAAWGSAFGIDDLGENLYGLLVVSWMPTAWAVCLLSLSSCYYGVKRLASKGKASAVEIAASADPVLSRADMGKVEGPLGLRSYPPRPVGYLERRCREFFPSMGVSLLFMLGFSTAISAFAPIEYARHRPLYRAAQWGDASVTRVLAAVFDVNERTSSGYTPLYRAAFNGRADVTRVLLEAGADPNARSERTGYTPLYRAARGGHTDVVRALLAAGADPNARTGRTGSKPLYRAAQRGHADIVRALLAAGADPNVRNNRTGSTPLYWAALRGHADIARALLAAGADVDVPNKRTGSTPLYCAALHGRAAIVHDLLAAGADPNAGNNRGSTPLGAAQSRSHAETIALLEAAGATSPSGLQ